MSGITLAEAQRVIAASLAKAEELGLTVAVAVVDLQTSLVASARMDGTNPFTPDVTRGKAVATAVTKGTPSGAAASRFPQGLLDTVRDLYGGRVTWVQGAVPIFRGGELAGAVAAGGGRVTWVQGAVPIFRGGELAGAVAAGGGPPDKDEEVAQAGADALR